MQDGLIEGHSYQKKSMLHIYSLPCVGSFTAPGIDTRVYDRRDDGLYFYLVIG